MKREIPGPVVRGGKPGPHDEQFLLYRVQRRLRGLNIADWAHMKLQAAFRATQGRRSSPDTRVVDLVLRNAMHAPKFQALS